MTPFMQSWIAKLRDPETKQTKKVLMNSTGAMCCLGVGLVVAGEKHEQPYACEPFEFGPTGEKTMPNDRQLILLGITQGLASALANANDRGATFAEIADFLETGDETVLAGIISVEQDLDALKGYKP